MGGGRYLLRLLCCLRYGLLLEIKGCTVYCSVGVARRPPPVLNGEIYQTTVLEHLRPRGLQGPHRRLMDVPDAADQVDDVDILTRFHSGPGPAAVPKKNSHPRRRLRLLDCSISFRPSLCIFGFQLLLSSRGMRHWIRFGNSG